MPLHINPLNYGGALASVAALGVDCGSLSPLATDLVKASEAALVLLNRRSARCLFGSGACLVAQSTTLVNSPEKTQGGGSQVTDRIDVPDF